MKVFYRDEQTVHLVDVFSPSARKPAIVLCAWQDVFGASIELAAFRPLDERDFHAAHDPAYVRRVFGLAAANGFGTRSQEVADSLRYTTTRDVTRFPRFRIEQPVGPLWPLVYGDVIEAEPIGDDLWRRSCTEGSAKSA